MFKIFLLSIFAATASSAIITQSSDKLDNPTRQLKCLDMIKGEGEFTFEQTSEESKCIVYFIAEFDEILQLRLSNKNFDCNRESVDLVYGWIRHGQTIPRDSHHHQIEHMCSTETIYVTRQNAAMLLIKLERGSTFTISSMAQKVNNVCDAIVPGLESRWASYSISPKNSSESCSLHIFEDVQINLPVKRLRSNPKNTIRVRDVERGEETGISPGETLYKTGYTVINVSTKTRIRLKQRRSKTRRHTRRFRKFYH